MIKKEKGESEQKFEDDALKNLFFALMEIRVESRGESITELDPELMKRYFAMKKLCLKLSGYEKSSKKINELYKDLMLLDLFVEEARRDLDMVSELWE